MFRAIILKVSMSVLGVGAVLFLTKAWDADQKPKSNGHLAKEHAPRSKKNIK